jgi:hypothetical protein
LSALADVWLRIEGNEEIILHVGGKLSRRGGSSGKELVEAGGWATEGQGPQKPRWYRSAGGRILELAGDAVTATLGEKGENLRGNLRDLGQSVRGQPADVGGAGEPTPPDDAERSARPFETTWMGFAERAEVVLELTHLVPEVMTPAGWAHIVRAPLERAQELLAHMRRIFPKGSGWEQTVSSCHGMMTNMERAATQLQSMHKPTGESSDGPATDRDVSRAKVNQTLIEARIALGDLRTSFRRLVEAADYAAIGESRGA